MLSLFLAHIIITIACLWSGWLFYNLVSGENNERPVIFYAISGLILITTITQIVVLFFPIGFYVKLFISLSLLLAGLAKRKSFRDFYARIYSGFSLLSNLSSVLFILIWAIILLISAGPTVMDDTDSYHIQSIKWIQEFGSVPGLVNLHERFGFNSSWFSSAALFSFSPGTSGGFTVLNSVLSMWLCYWLISKYNLLQKESKPHAAFSLLIVLIISILIWPLLRGNAATTNYDFIATCIVLILFTDIVLAKNKEISPSIEWIIWPAYLFTVRIINFPLLLLSLMALIIFVKQKKARALFLPIVYCLVLIIPFIIRNIIIAGYPFYPAPYFDLGNVDWKPDPQTTERLLEYIKYYNRVSTTYLEIEQTKALGSNWIPSWFNYLFPFDKALLIAGSIGIIAPVIKLSGQKNKKKILLIAISIVWLICWFIISPDPRFVYGLLLFGVFLFACYFFSVIKNWQLLKHLSGILIIVMITASGFYFVSKPWKQPAYRNWMLPAQLPHPPVKEFLTDDIILRIPEPINNNWNSRCYGTDLPCLYKIDPRLKARGKNIGNGFRLEK